jgi:hypothetical protein
VRVVGTEAEAPLTYREADLRGPLALVVGSEAHGLSPAVRRRCDLLVRIPMRGRVASLNAAVAGSILVFEAAAQRARVAGATGEGAPASDAAEGDPATTGAATGDRAAADAAAEDPATTDPSRSRPAPSGDGDAPTADPGRPVEASVEDPAGGSRQDSCGN